jgi:hypothetical protein
MLASAPVCSRALAQTSPATTRAKAEALNRQAALEMQERDYASACPKFAEVVQLVPTGIGAKMSLAACYEQWGRLASALEAYRLAEQAASKAHDPRESAAHAQAVTLEAKVATLRVVMPIPVGALPGLKITRDGEELRSEAWNKPLPIDKGRHILRAVANGKDVWTRKVDIDRDGFQASITVPMLHDIAPVKQPTP